MTIYTLTDYELFIYSLYDRYATILTSTLHLIRTGPASGRGIGRLTFAKDIQLEVAELVDFDLGQLEILEYGYVIYQGNERRYWYDSQAHPNDSTLASTHPHHKHIPPDIKHHRIPAPELSFMRPNLLFLISEIEQLIQSL